MTSLTNLADGWREEAEVLRGRYGAEDLAKLCETHAAELERSIAEHENEELDLAAAAAESRYSASQLRRIFGARTKIRRGDLPRKAQGTRQAGTGGIGVSKETASDEIGARLDARFARSRRKG